MHQAKREKWPVRLVIGAVVLVVLALFGLAASRGNTPIADTTGSTVADECRAALGYDARSADDMVWLNTCVHALTPPVIGSPTNSPSPSTSPSSSPTAGPTSSPTPSPSASPTAGPTTAPPTSTPPTSTSPSSSPTGGPMTHCADHPAACGFPDASSTGPESGTVLTDYTGPSTISTTGTLIQNVRMGCITISGTNITLRNVVITCGNSSYAVQTVGAADTGGTTTITHVTVVCTGHGGTAFGDNRMFIAFANISHCENGGDADGNFTIMKSYIHDMFLGDSTAPDPHTDGIQVWPSAPAIVYSGNTVLMTDTNSTFTSGRPVNGNAAHLTVVNNLLIGGSYEIYWSSNTGTLSGNRFGDLGGWNAAHTILFAPYGYCSECNTASANVLDSTGQALTLAMLNA